jgi:hypothetical protein
VLKVSKSTLVSHHWEIEKIWNYPDSTIAGRPIKLGKKATHEKKKKTPGVCKKSRERQILRINIVV